MKFLRNNVGEFLVMFERHEIELQLQFMYSLHPKTKEDAVEIQRVINALENKPRPYLHVVKENENG